MMFVGSTELKVPCSLPDTSWFCGSVWSASERSLNFMLCPAPGGAPKNGDYPLMFATAQEADVIVSGDNGFCWTWSRGQQFEAQPQTKRLVFCVMWWTEWDLIGDDGSLVPNGHYDITFTSTAEELRGYEFTARMFLNFTH